MMCVLTQSMRDESASRRPPDIAAIIANGTLPELKKIQPQKNKKEMHFHNGPISILLASEPWGVPTSSLQLLTI